MIAIPMCFGMAAVANYLIPLYLGNEFLPSVTLLQIFSTLLIVVGLNNAVGKQVLMPMGRQNKYNISVIIGAFTNCVLNILLIPRFYAIGAAVASVAAEMVILLVFLHFSKDMITIKWLLKNSLNYVLASVIMFLTIRLSYFVLPESWVSVIAQLIIGVIVYFAIVFILRDEFTVAGAKTIIKELKQKIS